MSVRVWAPRSAACRRRSVACTCSGAPGGAAPRDGARRTPCRDDSRSTEPIRSRLHEGDAEVREPNGDTGLEHGHEVRHHRERMSERVHGERRSELLELERKDRVDGLDAVDRDGQAGFLRRVEHGVVLLVPVERLQPRRRQVRADVRRVVGVLADLRSAGGGTLRRDHHGPEQRGLVPEPAIGEPVVVRPREPDRESRIAHHRAARAGGRGRAPRRRRGADRARGASHAATRDDLRPIRAARPGDAELRPR